MSDYRLLAREFGGPEVIFAEPIVPGPIPPGRVRVRHRAIGVNFIDTYHRTGLYPQPLPAGLGVEAAGVVEELGRGGEGVEIGQRVGYALSQTGSYASWQDVPAVKNGQLFEIKSADILQPGPAALTDGVDQLHRIISQWALHHA